MKYKNRKFKDITLFKNKVKFLRKKKFYNVVSGGEVVGLMGFGCKGLKELVVRIFRDNRDI